MCSQNLDSQPGLLTCGLTNSTAPCTPSGPEQNTHEPGLALMPRASFGGTLPTTEGSSREKKLLQNKHAASPLQPLAST